MTIIQASFFWNNDQPGGIGITFGSPTFTSSELQTMFHGPVAKKYMRDSDDALGSNIVNDMLGQLTAIGEAKMRGSPPTSRQAILAALNIMWLSSRGFISDDEFNGTQFLNYQGQK